MTRVLLILLICLAILAASAACGCLMEAVLT